MSFNLKLSALLNPASPGPPSPSSPVTQSPEAVSSSSYRHAPQGSYTSRQPSLPSMTSQHEAATTLPSLASSSASYPRAHTYSLSPPPLQRGSPVLPPLPFGTRRPSLVLPAIADCSPTSSHPSTSLLEQYHHKSSSSRSPDDLSWRRHSYPYLDAGGGPQLPPLHTLQAPVAASADPREQGPDPHASVSSETYTSQVSNSAAHFALPKKMDEHGLDGAVIAQAATSQIREPSAAASEAKMTPVAPEPAIRYPLDQQSPTADIKSEPVGASIESTPSGWRHESAQDQDLDLDTMAAIELAKNEFSTREKKPRAGNVVQDLLPSAATIGEVKGKKRAAPKVKKGQATVKKPPAKRRKVEETATTKAPKPQTELSASGKKSQSNTPGLGSSPGPDSTYSGEASQYGSASEGEDDGAYCICRKGDNHTWMIACDGGCEDWFHGKCVNILESDGELIDKYICPNCEKKMGKVTTWKPACRNPTCRKPARIKKGEQSKYCSDECGLEFMKTNVKRSADMRRQADGHVPERKPKRKGVTPAEMNGLGHGDDSDDDLGPRGGALKPSELKALVTATSDVTDFRNLGQGVLSPPLTASTNHDRFPDKPGDDAHHTYTLSTAEEAQISAIGAQKDDLRRRRALLKEREKFGMMIRENVARYADREGLKPKDLCGYDARLTWGDAEFSLWRESPAGRVALADQKLDLPGDEPVLNGAANGADAMDVDTPATHAAVPKTLLNAPPNVEGKRGWICVRKRCEKHRYWQKGAVADIRFEESQLAETMRALDARLRGIEEGARLRARIDAAGLRRDGSVSIVA